jgi:tetratricopeptide (TPR) repeat protein
MRGGERLYRARLFVRRNRVAVAAASAAVLALTLGLAVAAQQARIARAEAARATSTSEFLQEIISAADPTMSGREPTLLEALDAASARIATRFAGQPDTESGIRHALGNAYTNLVQLPKARAQLDAALALREPDTVPYAELLKAVAVLDWSEGDTGSAERRYREALAIVDDHDDAAARELRGEILNDLAVLQTDSGRPADAVPLAEQVVALGRASGLAERKLGTRLAWHSVRTSLCGPSVLADLDPLGRARASRRRARTAKIAGCVSSRSNKSTYSPPCRTAAILWPWCWMPKVSPMPTCNASRTGPIFPRRPSCCPRQRPVPITAYASSRHARSCHSPDIRAWARPTPCWKPNGRGNTITWW